ncbi:unnamed protein product (macronuclear) [Paramecium tetraurelia]|uniref:Enkurin domain-containing protein n=1 Tax=Paramecium tetraurelia TaxID=5888 RepID=A0ECY0_PARTE|nr:uncharacterized protein GSPATT00004016001 [Paramecium tetraurelia]CAK93147.1 unnamed protein product [Paramecium tetraurelia]|eukprot:XP_001460544.1 hypothetical protein (macronuclear) [Paramecium tetraurelia strain d4-2]
MKYSQTTLQNSPSQFTIPVNSSDSQNWNDVKKGIRDKVYSKVQGFENQKFIQKSELLYNFKNQEEKNSNQPLSHRQSATHLKNLMDNKFPKQESPIKMGLTRAIYSPSQKQYHPLDDIQIKNNYQSAFGSAINKEKVKVQSSKKEQYSSSKPMSDLLDMKRNKAVTERATLAEIIRISNHLQDVQQAEATQLSSAYLQELIALQQNIGKVLKNTSSKVYK